MSRQIRNSFSRPRRLIHSKAQEIVLFGYGSTGTPFAPDRFESYRLQLHSGAENDQPVSCNLLELKAFIVIRTDYNIASATFAWVCPQSRDDNSKAVQARPASGDGTPRNARKAPSLGWTGEDGCCSRKLL